MRFFDPLGWPRVFLVTIVGTLFCVGVALYIDSFNFAYMSEEAVRRAIFTNIFIPTILAGPLLFILMWKMRQLARAHHELQIIASTDNLTAVLNRGAFTMLVEAYLEEAAHEARLRQGALLVVDVDHFKKINDEFGHDRGDDALKAIAGSIKQALRAGDMVGRLGGEEFGVFLPGANPDQALTVAERVRSAVCGIDFTAGGMRTVLSVSVGGVIFTEVAPFPTLYAAADRNLYEAKNAGRNRVLIEEFVADFIRTPPRLRPG